MKNLLPKLKSLLTLKTVLILSVGILQFAFTAILLLSSGWSFAIILLRLFVLAAMAGIYYVFYEIVFYHGEQNGRIIPWLESKLSVKTPTHSMYVEGKLDAFAEILSRIRSYNSVFLENLKNKIISKLQ